jgi:hypothetical protein
MNTKANLLLRNESGAALVVALLMIVILSLIGIASSSNSTFEIRLSGNKRGATDAFFTADAGIKAIMGDVNNFLCADTNTAGVPTEIISEGFGGKQTSGFTFNLPAGFAFADQPTMNVYRTTQTRVPRGLGVSAIAFQYNYYIIDSTGRDQMDLGTVKSNCEIREKIVRLIPTGN